jgi:glucose/arabinose dehydrogenase
MSRSAFAAIVALIWVVSTMLLGRAEQATRADAVTQLYNDQCASCHGATLAGGRTTSLLDDRWVYGGDDESVTHSIRQGRPEADMPAFGDALTDAQIRALVVFIREAALRARGTPAERATPMPEGIIRSERHAFRIETVTDGLETPWAIAFLPDGRMLVTERPGRLRIIESGRLISEPITGTPAVWHHQDGGLFDVEIHPDYSRNGWIYLSYSEPGQSNRSADTASPSGPSMTVIIRGRIRNGAWVDQETLYRASPELYWINNSHYGSRFIFDRQGHLFYTIGDRGRQDDAQDLSLPNGKIHRVMDDGRVPRDNPFVNRRGALGSIWSYGNRNAQGLAWHPVTGTLWATEHGPRGGDELNIIQPGRNYGWPVVSYGLLDGGDGGVATPSTTKEGMEQPVVQWTPSPGICPIAFYTGTRFPNWQHDLLVGSMGHEELRRLVVDRETVVRQEVLLRGLGRVRDIVTGPDGYVYLALANPGVLLSSTTAGRIVRLIPAS